MSEILIDRTGRPEVIAASDGSLTVTVPIRIKRRGSAQRRDSAGRRCRVTPSLGWYADAAPACARPRAPLAGPPGIG